MSSIRCPGMVSPSVVKTKDEAVLEGEAEEMVLEETISEAIRYPITIETRCRLLTAIF